jgi:hypothetical protein
MALDRRTLLGSIAATLGLAGAGCSAPGGSSTPQPTLSSSRQITVYNDDDEPQDVTITVSRDGGRVFESRFELGPGDSRQTQGVTRPGEYRVQVELAGGESTTSTWTVGERRGGAQVNISREGNIAFGQEVRAGGG